MRVSYKVEPKYDLDLQVALRIGYGRTHGNRRTNTAMTADFRLIPSKSLRWNWDELGYWRYIRYESHLFEKHGPSVRFHIHRTHLSKGQLSANLALVILLYRREHCNITPYFLVLPPQLLAHPYNMLMNWRRAHYLDRCLYLHLVLCQSLPEMLSVLLLTSRGKSRWCALSSIQHACQDTAVGNHTNPSERLRDRTGTS